MNTSAQAIFSSLIITLALSGCGDDDGAGLDGNGPEPLTPISPAPEELVGDWKFGTISFTNFWSSQGQYIGNGGGTAVRFSIEPDGRYAQQVYLSRRNYGCVMETWTETVGTATFDDGELTIYPTRGRYKASDTCSDANNFDRPMTDQEREDFVKTFLWKFEVNPLDGETYLMLGFDENTWSHFEPVE
jgi:hypothetical protein